MLDGNRAVHAGIFFNDPGVSVAGDEDIGSDVGEGAVRRLAEQLAECIGVDQSVCD